MGTTTATSITPGIRFPGSERSAAPVLVENEGRNDQVGTGSLPILPSDDEASAAFRHGHGVIVYGKSVRRRVYLNLPAAEGALRRAHDRGDEAYMVLVELVPVVGGA
jgi:hypothetical protein